MIIVNNGEREFNMPAIKLGTVVCAIENKNAGIPFPKRPVAKINFHWCFSTLDTWRITNGSRQKNAADKRMLATCDGVKSSRPLFIRIKELPQMSASKIISDHLKAGVLIFFIA